MTVSMRAGKAGSYHREFGGAFESSACLRLPHFRRARDTRVFLSLHLTLGASSSSCYR